jgi:adenylate kinase
MFEVRHFVLLEDYECLRAPFFAQLESHDGTYNLAILLLTFSLIISLSLSIASFFTTVRLCVQGSMGVGIFTGVPKQLSGVSKLIQMMDWQSGEGQENEGMIGNYVNFGNVGAEHVKNQVRDAVTGNITQYQDDVFIIIAPQSMVGTDSSIIPNLQAMVKAAGDRPVILINPDLTDKISAAGQQSVRGRQERIDFANSFETIWQFQNIYVRKRWNYSWQNDHE